LATDGTNPETLKDKVGSQARIKPGFWGPKTRHMKNLVAILVTILVMSSCTDNVRARHWGGTETLALNPNEVVLNVTWKDNDMWICTKDTTSGVVYFREKSSWGMVEGAVVFK